MKKIFVLIVLGLVFIFNTVGQSNFSCNAKKVCYYNSETKKYDKCSESVEDVSLFVVNSKETIITYTSNKLSSCFFVKEKIVDNAYNTFSYVVNSDVGKSFVITFDIDDNEIRILVMNDDLTFYNLIYSVKAVWVD